MSITYRIFYYLVSSKKRTNVDNTFWGFPLGHAHYKKCIRCKKTYTFDVTSIPCKNNHSKNRYFL